MCESKVCIITTCNLKYAPYVKLYTDILDKINVKYDLVTWNKNNLSENIKYSYCGKKNDGKMIKSFFQYIGFGRFLDRIMQKNDYSQLIVCNPAPLLFVKRKTIKKYNKRFVWDIRDDTPIRKYFKRRFLQICNCASFIVSSSKRYEEWIEHPVIMSHNANKGMLLNYWDYLPKKRMDCSCLRILNAGKMIESQENIRVLDALKNSDEYIFSYYGSDVPGKINLMNHCKTHNISNVSFMGTYNKDDIVSIYRTKADLINILRENTVVNKNALPNKFYESVIAGIPLVVYEHNTAISEYVNKYYLGIVLKDTSEVAKIKELYMLFDFDRYAQGRNQFLKAVLRDIENFEASIRNFVA